MSESRATVGASRGLQDAAEPSRLRVVARRRPRAPRLPFVVLVALVLIGGVVGLLLFNTSMQQRSFRASTLEARSADLHAAEQSLQRQLDRLRDPQEVAARAQRLGMVPIVNPAFLRLSDGSVLGDARPASGQDVQRLTPLPTREPAGYHPRAHVVAWDDAAARRRLEAANSPGGGAAPPAQPTQAGTKTSTGSR